MRHLLLAVLLLPSCAASRTIDLTLIPAVQSAWPNVRADLELGLEVGEIPENSALAGKLLTLDNAIQTGNGHVLRANDWPSLEVWAVRGVLERIHRGELSEGVATSLYERILRFGEAMDTLAGRSVSRVSFPYNHKQRSHQVRLALGLPIRKHYLIRTQADVELVYQAWRSRQIRLVEQAVEIVRSAVR